MGKMGLRVTPPPPGQSNFPPALPSCAGENKGSRIRQGPARGWRSLPRTHTHTCGGVSRPRAPPQDWGSGDRGLGAVGSPVGLVTGPPRHAAPNRVLQGRQRRPWEGRDRERR